MIAVDTSTLVAYFSGDFAQDTDTLQKAVMANRVAVCPIVVTECLSGTIDAHVMSLMANMDRLAFADGFWERAADSRRKLFQKGLKAKLADAIIAQSSIDHGIPLLTRDKDFRHYATLCRLQLA